MFPPPHPQALPESFQDSQEKAFTLGNEMLKARSVETKWLRLGWAPRAPLILFSENPPA